MAKEAKDRKDKTKVHNGHRERVKERFIKTGLEGFEDHQLLELLLFYAYPRQDTNPIAHKMINEFGSLCNLLEASPLDIMEKCKTTKNIAVLISLILPISRKYLVGKQPKGELLDSVQKASKYAINLFMGIKNECFYMICLDIQHRLTTTVCLGQGDLDEVTLYPKQLVAEAIRNKAHCVILTHNHPSGEIRPSGSDIESTKLIKSALEPIGIELLDHIIIGNERYFSFSEKGKLDTVY